MDIELLRSELVQHNQEHLLQFWDHLSEQQKNSLYHELKSQNYEEINQYFKTAMATLENASEKLDDLLEPLPSDVCGGVARCDKQTVENYRKSGLEAIGNNNVGLLLLAGGQGTRLGVDYPKGMYDVNLPSGKTLYQIQAERILRLQHLGQLQNGKPCVVPWYVMTSEHTKDKTLHFFEKNDYFGLKKENIVVFEQGLLPCIDFDGKIILEKPHKLALAPDGNGGLYRALRKNKILDDMEKRGIKYIHVYCVDNILVRVADPVFIGFCINKGASCGAKVVEKTIPTEAVGVVCKVDGRFQVVEYSEITLKTAEKRNKDGRLSFNAGNICNHFFTLEFLQHVSDPKQEKELQHHVAKKKIPYADNVGNLINPNKPNGIKMEKFVFDVFHFATNFAVWEVLREDEFSPLKNADGADKDTPTTCRSSLCNLHHRLILGAGGKFVHKDGSPIPDIPSQHSGDEHEDIICEISPLASYSGEGLEEHVQGRSLIPPVLINCDDQGRVVVMQEAALNGEL
ncbi:hypothetical protein ACJMK2_020196 [Sinanodonta woodiana]|uniref:UDP-N-acetylglucosamine diphosphorylase n=1 Tax=Sinanodonta woodiana TaxID=1069815 RepID=A0ABD3TYN3_SINWO